MSLLSSKFDVQSVDNPVAVAALAQILSVGAGMTLNANGTPVAGSIPPGAVVQMDSGGLAVLATTGDISMVRPALTFIALDGNTDFSGSFVQNITVLAGGYTMVTDQYAAGSYTPGDPVTFSAGKIAAVAAATNQVIGYVGPKGLDTTNGILQVIMPQGCGL